MKGTVLITLAALCLLTAVAGAQDPPKTFVEARGNVIPVPQPPGGPPPRMTDGHVDFSGVWFSGPTGKANAWSVVAEAPTTRQDPTENFCTNNENVEQLLKLNENESKGR
jgi:hypothetical protein